jgi:NADH-quinone oxidoreductase subunit J
MDRLIFDVAAVVAVLFAALMVLNRNPVRSVLALVVSFFFLAIGYVLLWAPFIAAIQVIVYAGAILVLFLFVLMLLNVPLEDVAGTEPRPIQQILGGAAILLFTIGLVELLSGYGAKNVTQAGAMDFARGRIGPLARLIYSEYLLPFEALSVLLLAALVGAFVLVEREKRP